MNQPSKLRLRFVIGTALMMAALGSCNTEHSAPSMSPPDPGTRAPIPVGLNMGLFDPPDWAAQHPGWGHATFTNPRGYAGLLRQTGAKWVRIPINWADLADRETGHIDLTRPEWTRIDTTVRILRDNGFSIVGVLAHHTWSEPRGYPSLDAWRTFVRETTQRLGASISHWSVWNEPNCVGYLSRGSEPATADDYAELVRVASPEIRGAGGKVIGGEISWWDEGNALCRAGRPFLLRTLVLASDAIDIVSITVYKADARAIRAAVDSAWQTLHAGPWPQPLWVTEFGVAGDAPPDSLEADLVTDMLVRPPAGVENLFFWHGFIWNADDRHGMLKPMDSTMGANHHWIYSTPVPRLSYVAHLYARNGCSWRSSCPAAALPLIDARISGPDTVQPNVQCSWRTRITGAVWPYTNAVWNAGAGDLTYGGAAAFRATSKRLVLEFTQTDALGRPITARREVAVSSVGRPCR